jgi:EAL domain-containing protein (putative c-di-GMP-specific phosphodiesterase class I)
LQVVNGSGDRRRRGSISQQLFPLSSLRSQSIRPDPTGASSFIDDVSNTDGSSSIVQAVVTNAAARNMTTTAEGVETQQRFNLLRHRPVRRSLQSGVLLLRRSR